MSTDLGCDKCGRLLPWILSVFLHLGVGMVLGFAAMIAQASVSTSSAAGGDEMIVPEPVFGPEPGGKLNPGPALSGQAGSPTGGNVRSDFARADQVSDEGIRGKHQSISVANGIFSSTGDDKGGGDVLGLSNRRRGSEFFGENIGGGGGGNVHHVVYVIDRSGSMVDEFDNVRREMLYSISRLRPEQDFHVIFFASGTPIENPPQQLVSATPEYRSQAAVFLNDVRPEGQTNPVPALTRAFQVLSKADANKKGKLILLLTDGAFPDNQKVLDTIGTFNAKKDVHISTFLYGDRSKDASAMMQKIARDNGGRFKQVGIEQ